MPPFLLLHGWEGSGPGHWQPWLAERLAAGGHEVSFPELPDPFTPEPATWGAALATELERLRRPPVVVCHSLACILWLRHAAAGGRAADRVLLVAPPGPTGVPPLLAPFFPVPLDRAAVHAAARETRIVCSGDDPYCPEGAIALSAGPLALPADVIAGGGHLNADTGFGPWPAVQAWCERGTTPITR